MSIIYPPAGRAKEYCELAVNLYRGCGHGCIYCYAPSATRSDREKFYTQPQPRVDVINKLRKQLKTYEGDKPILLSFTSDPYQPLDEELQLTRQAIKLLKDNGQKIVILSKGGKRMERDYDLLDNEDFVGATLTFVNEKDSLEWEPGAALPSERMSALKKAKSMGISTWASLEPVIDPEQSLEIIRQTHEYIDLYKIGVLNYHKKAKETDWYKFADEVMKLLKLYGNKYYIKNDLKPYLTAE